MSRKDSSNSEKVDAKVEQLRSDFEGLPLESKITTLLRMEALTLSETVQIAVNSPLKVIEKIGEALIDLGTKIEREVQKAADPSDEDKTEPPAAGQNESPKPKRRRPPRANREPTR